MKPARLAVVAGILAAAAGFAFKIASFLWSAGAPETDGFLAVPVTTYFTVTAGMIALLLWAFASGQFENLETPKHRLLETEAEHDRAEHDA